MILNTWIPRGSYLSQINDASFRNQTALWDVANFFFLLKRDNICSCRPNVDFVE